MVLDVNGKLALEKATHLGLMQHGVGKDEKKPIAPEGAVHKPR